MAVREAVMADATAAASACNACSDTFSFNVKEEASGPNLSNAHRSVPLSSTAEGAAAVALLASLLLPFSEAEAEVEAEVEAEGVACTASDLERLRSSKRSSELTASTMLGESLECSCENNRVEVDRLPVGTGNTDALRDAVNGV
jgi:hypothetical protein